MMLSVQVIDAGNGVSGAEVGVSLFRASEEGRDLLAEGSTQAGGQLTLVETQLLPAATYRLEVDLDGYYAIQGGMPLYPRALVEFRLCDTTVDLHLLLVISHHSVLVCRGSKAD